MFFTVLYLMIMHYAWGQDNGTIILDKAMPATEVIITAKQEIRLNPGFRASATNGFFHAKIGNQNLLMPLMETAAGSTTTKNNLKKTEQ